MVSDEGSSCVLYSENEYIAFIQGEEIVINNVTQSGSFNLQGNFLGDCIIIIFKQQEGRRVTFQDIRSYHVET